MHVRNVVIQNTIGSEENKPSNASLVAIGFLVLQPYGFVFAGIAILRDADGVFTRFRQTDADTLFCFNADRREERVASTITVSINLGILAIYPFHAVTSQVEV